MAKIAARLWVAAVIAAGCGLGVGFGQPPVMPPPQPPGPPYYFPTAVGARWVYEERINGDRVGEYAEVVTRVRGTGPARLVSVGRVAEDGTVEPAGFVLATPGRLARITGAGRAEPFFEYLGPAARLQNPLPFPGPRGSPLAGRERYWVGFPERVAVPAGTFAAVRVTAEPPEPTGSGTTLELRFHEETWYAPGVGLVRRKAGPAETVLKSFTPGRE